MEGQIKLEKKDIVTYPVKRSGIVTGIGINVNCQDKLHIILSDEAMEEFIKDWQNIKSKVKYKT